MPETAPPLSSERLHDALTRTRAWLGRATPSQRLGVSAAGGGLLVALLFALVGPGGAPPYASLYSRLGLEDTSLIVERLETMGVPHRISESGDGIMVPRERVGAARLALAKDGLPRNPRSGFALLEKSRLGETQGIVDAKLLRAHEERIESTLMELLEVGDARVHLAVAPDALFTEDRIPSTASVMLSLLPGVSLDPGRVEAIRRMVAGAVSGLDATQVTVADSMGRLLATGGDTHEPGSESILALRLKREIESYLSLKAQRLLESVLGPGHATVAVDVSLQNEAIDREITTYDPDQSVVRSEQRRDADDTLGESSTTNYEVSSRIERIVSGPGSIERLTAAIFVEERSAESKSGSGPRGPAELARLREMVTAALGADPSRGDVVTISDVPFDRSHENLRLNAIRETQRTEFIHTALWCLALLVGLGAATLQVRRMTASRRPTPPPSPTINPKPDDPTRPLDHPRVSTEEERRRQIHEEINQLASDEPENIAQLIRTWLNESTFSSHERR